ncbi:PAS domain-containing protein [Candidatus Falkowbacteria bacterium]|nr:PAS domain-containing protein [Candidatus Falkowbacteria bacterium]
MVTSSKLTTIRRRLFPGETLQEIITKELQDFFFTGLFRLEFFLMGGFSVVMLFLSYQLIINSHIAVGGRQGALDLYFSYAILGAYFFCSDFVKRKQLLPEKPHFIIDSAIFYFLMSIIVYLTGGINSPLAFPMLFLMSISAPLYGSMKYAVAFVGIACVTYLSWAVIGDDLTLEFYGHILEAFSLMIATIIIKSEINRFAKKAEEYKSLTRQNDELLAKMKDYNESLESTVKHKTTELSDSLKLVEASKKEIENQRAATMNILDDIIEERNATSFEKDKLSAILQSIGDGVMVVDEKGVVTICNRVAEKITGYSYDEVAGKNYSEFFKLVYEKDGQPNDIIAKVFKTRKIEELTDHTVLIRKDGNKVPVADSAAPIFSKSGEVVGCIIVYRDVTREREIDRQKSEFVSVASHQLRTPLTSIKWFLEMMLDGDAGTVSDEQKELLEQVSESTERMIGLVNTLLNISRIESGRVKVDPRPTDLNHLIETIVQEQLPIATQRGVGLKVSKPELPVISIDQKLVQEVFANLLSNAIKYTPNKGKVALKARLDGEFIEFTISDTGMGIPDKDKDKMFHKFFRAENAVVRETEGNGMGLYVCKSIVELSGGRIWYDSVENKGTTFYFTLPLKGSIMREGEKSLV